MNAAIEAQWKGSARGIARPRSPIVDGTALEFIGYEWMHAIRWGVVIDRVVWSAITVVLVLYFWP